MTGSVDFCRLPFFTTATMITESPAGDRLAAAHRPSTCFFDTVGIACQNILRFSRKNCNVSARGNAEKLPFSGDHSDMVSADRNEKVCTGVVNAGLNCELRTFPLVTKYSNSEVSQPLYDLLWCFIFEGFELFSCCFWTFSCESRIFYFFWQICFPGAGVKFCSTVMIMGYNQ